MARFAPALIVLLASAPSWGLDNFGEVSPGLLLRSAQPSEKDYDELKRRGVKTIISLRQSNPREERPKVEKRGMNFVNVPIRDRSTPSRRQVFEFLGAVVDPANRPSLVHCQKGRGRTGIMVAAYRIIIDGFDEGRALDEGRRFGLSSNKQRRYVQDLARDYRDGRLEAEVVGVLGSSICDRGNQPAPHWGVKGNRCLQSCGALGGTKSSSRPCVQEGLASAGDAYDVPYCCR